jgi:protease I
MKLHDKRVAILVEDNYDALEVWYPALRLRAAGAEVTIVGTQARCYVSTHGIPVRAQVSADQVTADDLAAIVIPGGSAAEAISYQPTMLALIYDALQRGKVLAMIVTARSTLAAAPGACDKSTLELFGMQEEMRKDKGPFGDGPIICEGNLIKARTPADLQAFCGMIIAALSAPQCGQRQPGLAGLGPCHTAG